MKPTLLLPLCLSHIFGGLARAQFDAVPEVLSGVPSCARSCITRVFAGTACTLTNVAECLCANVTLQTSLSACTQTNCLFADQIAAASIETELCAGFPVASKSWEVQRTTLAGCVVVFPVIALRLYSRLAYTKKLWIDDYMTIFAAVLLVVLGVLDLYNAHIGLGMHYWTVPVHDGTLILKLFYIHSMVYMVVLVVGKVSILLVYLRIFPDRRFRYAVHGLSAFLLLHGVLYFLLTALQCLPVSSLWDRYITDHRCMNANYILYSSGILSIFEDLAILLLPMRSIWQLNIHRRRRLTVLALISIGSFACLTSMIRMKYVVQYSATFDATWDNVDIVVWSAIEQFSALLCGSLPALRPLLVAFITKLCPKRDNIEPHREGQETISPFTQQTAVPISMATRHDRFSLVVTRASANVRDQQSGPKRESKGPESQIEVTTTVDVEWGPRTWFDESLHNDEDKIELTYSNIPQAHSECTKQAPALGARNGRREK